MLLFIKRSILLFISIFITLSVFSQTNTIKTTKRGKPVKRYYEVALGFSIPRFNYENTIYENGVGQAAISGPNLQLGASTEINKRWGYKYVADIMFYTEKKYNQISEYKKVESGFWINLNFAVGAFINLDYGKTNINLSINGGFMSISSPFVKYTYESLKVIEHKSGFGIGFSLKPEISAHYELTDEIALKIFLNYITAPVLFESKHVKTHLILKDSKEINIFQYINTGIGIQF